MTRWRVLVSAPYFQLVVERFRDRLESAGCTLVIPEVTERLEEHELLASIADIDGVIAGDDRFTERVFAAANKLKVISKWGTGIDSIDQSAARTRGIAVRNTPNAFTQPVADSTLGYILCFARQIPWASDRVKCGDWAKIPGVSLSECTLGVIGVGNIGKAVTKRARAFGMRVMGNDIAAIEPSFVSESELEVVAKPALFAAADFVTLHCDLNHTSHHIISSAELETMKSTAYLVNTARGPLVDESALVDALRSGSIAGAALDVFETEPLPDTSPLRQLEQVLLAPHNSNSSPEAWERVHDSTIRNLLDELEARS